MTKQILTEREIHWLGEMDETMNALIKKCQHVTPLEKRRGTAGRAIVTHIEQQGEEGVLDAAEFFEKYCDDTKEYLEQLIRVANWALDRLDYTKMELTHGTFAGRVKEMK